jgi:hypothetical protein
MKIKAMTRWSVRGASIRNVRRFSLMVFLLALFVGSAPPVFGAIPLNHPGSTLAHETGHFGSCIETKSFMTGQFIFSYPTCWTLRNNLESSMFSTVLVALSNQSMHNPCHTERSGSNVVTSCGFPVKTLKQGGVLVELIQGSMPGWKITREPGRHFTLDHHAARESMTRNPLGTLHATEEISVFIDSDIVDNFYDIDAFFRGPGVAGNQLVLEKMLKSVRFDKFE